jgi:hypothetical protein
MYDQTQGFWCCVFLILTLGIPLLNSKHMVVSMLNPGNVSTVDSTWPYNLGVNQTFAWIGVHPNVSTLKGRANKVLMNEIDRNPEERIAMQMSIHSPELGLLCWWQPNHCELITCQNMKPVGIQQRVRWLYQPNIVARAVFVQISQQ